jgi:hypothetical protein
MRYSDRCDFSNGGAVVSGGIFADRMRLRLLQTLIAAGKEGLWL